MSGTPPLLSVRDLRVAFGESQILHGVSFDVCAGGITALLGRNGAGKTTTLRGILGLDERSGSVVFAGDDLSRAATHAIVKRGIGYVPENRDVFGSLTVEENLRIAERAGSESRYAYVYDLFPELRERAAQRAGTLSGGQQQMVALARAFLCAENRLMLVDEPTKGLSPLMVKRVADALAAAARDITILLVEQNLSVANLLATDAIVLDQGRVTYTGRGADLMDDRELARRHLGIATAAH
ncbi:MAG: ABC transporter ATP-binding protein [Candidatus Eremiobacteraeota bacterium]|nr:ABC transporter ATP-binding protein [Candidatus Eremiobacteraeota bacterium]